MDYSYMLQKFGEMRRCLLLPTDSEILSYMSTLNIFTGLYGSFHMKIEDLEKEKSDIRNYISNIVNIINKPIEYQENSDEYQKWGKNYILAQELTEEEKRIITDSVDSLASLFSIYYWSKRGQAE